MKEDDFITEVKTKFCEGMKEYYTYVVQHRDRMEIKSNQEKLDNEVNQYPEDVDERRTAEFHRDLNYSLLFNVLTQQLSHQMIENCLTIVREDTLLGMFLPS